MDEEQIKAYSEALKEIDIGDIAADMVRIPSYSFLKNQEKEIASYIHHFFVKESIESRIVEIEPGRYNVEAMIKGKGEGKSLMLSGHMDTVPSYDMESAFEGAIVDGVLYGRGACDMKGPLASMMSAMAAIKRSGITLQGDLIFTGLADEEEQGKGAGYLVNNGPFADGVIVGEPTEMKIDIGHKGLEWIEITVHGKKVHGGNKEAGINAIQMAARLIDRIYNQYVPVLNSREYPILGAPTINVGTITGGDQPSTVAGECVITLDRRCVPTESISQVYSELDQIISRLHREDPKFNGTIRNVFDGELMAHVPFCIDQKDRLVISIQEAMAAIERKNEVSAFPAWSDAGFISSNCNSQCVVMGPGNLAVAHSTEEQIKISDLQEAATVYGLTALNYCR